MFTIYFQAFIRACRRSLVINGSPETLTLMRIKKTLTDILLDAVVWLPGTIQLLMSLQHGKTVFHVSHQLTVSARNTYRDFGQRQE